MSLRNIYWTGVLSWLALSECSFLPRSQANAIGILDEALEALGGESVLKQLTGVTYEAPTVFRSRSLMQSYELNRGDTGLSITGSQNISFDLTSDVLKQRIDRRYVPSQYWVWGSPQLQAFDNSLVVQGGDDGFACYVRGNNEIWLPTDYASGYTNAALAEYLIHRGNMLSPSLLLKMKESESISTSIIKINGICMSAVHAPAMNITVIMNAASRLPYIIRTWEDHSIYGPSTNDLYLTDYKAVDDVLFPHLIQTIYNSTAQNLNAVLEDFVIEKITINTKFEFDFFDGLPETRALLRGDGVNDATVDDIKVVSPVPGLPNVHWVILDDQHLGVKQFIVEFEDGVLVGDAPPQWTNLVIKWIQENINKPITHVWPTHHHRDHSGGADQYVALGAKLIVPDMAASYWSSIPNAELITFNETHPFVYRNGKTQAWFMWQDQATHSSDWSYAVVTDRCPTTNSSIAAFEADVWHPDLPIAQNDQALMRQWLDQTLGDGLTQNAIVLPTHGQVRPLSEVIDTTGYLYPKMDLADWQHGEALC